MFIKDKKHRIQNSMLLLIIYQFLKYNPINCKILFFQFWTLLLEHVCFMKIMIMMMTEPRLSQAKVKKPVQKNEKKEKKFKGDAAKKFLLQIHTHTPGRQTERQTDKQAIRKSHYRIQTKGLIERRITHKGNN